MNTKIFIISESKVRQYTGLNNNVDKEFITNAIRESQDIHLQTLIGTKLYRKLLTSIENGTLTGIYQQMVDEYMEDFLIYATYYECLEEIMIRPRNNGLLSANGGDNSDSVSMSVYNVKRTSVENKKSFYAQRLAEFLCERMNEIPEIQSVQYLYEMYPDLDTQYSSPFVFNTDKSRIRALVNKGIQITNSRYKHLPQ